MADNTKPNHLSPIHYFGSPQHSSVPMASNSSFDIVSDFDYQEMVNAVDQTRRDIKGRYDLKDTDTVLELDPQKIVILTNSEFTLESVKQLLREKAARRQLSLKIFVENPLEAAGGNRVRQEITLQKGIDKELAKEISKAIRDSFKKVTASIQGDAVRVSSKSKNDLQGVIQFIREQDYDVPLQFNNYR